MLAGDACRGYLLTDTNLFLQSSRSEEEESEGDGSSIEEDDDDEILEQHEGVTMHENHAPVYEQELVNATAGSSIAPPLEMGANGYPVSSFFSKFPTTPPCIPLSLVVVFIG